MSGGPALPLRLALGYGLGAVGGGAGLSILAALGHGVSAGAHPPIVAAAGLLGAGLSGLRPSGRSRAAASTVHGSAHFAGAGGDSEPPDETALVVGRRGAEGADTGAKIPAPFIRYGGSAHLITIAPTRSGKGVGAIIPNLLLSPRSIVCIDPKGENAAIAAAARGRRGPVYVLDPFGVSGHASAAFNPLSSLNPESPDLAEDAFAVADALIHDPPGQAGEAHWNEEAKALIAGLILHVLTQEREAERTLTKVRALLTLGPDRMMALLDDMTASSAADGLVARAAHRHLSKSDREAAGVLSSAQRHTHFLDSPRMTAVLCKSDFRFEDLRTGCSTVFLVLPPDRLAAHARWLRLLVAQALFALARAGTVPTVGDRGPVLFLLDEFAALGHLQPVLTAFGLMAGYGVQLWVILQDLHQLKGVYGQAAGTFLSNAGLIQIFNVADVDTAVWVSRALGAGTEAFTTVGTSSSRGPAQWTPSRGSSAHEALTRRDLLTPDEVMRLDQDRLLLLRPGSPPMTARKLRYYEDQEFRGLFKDPKAAPAPRS